MPPRARKKEKAKRHQRKASRKQEAAKAADKPAKDWKRSNSWRRERIFLAKASRRERDREISILHETTIDLIREFGPNIAIEDLAIKNMTRGGGRRKRGLNRSILHQNWGRFLTILAYKCERAGGSFWSIQDTLRRHARSAAQDGMISVCPAGSSNARIAAWPCTGT